MSKPRSAATARLAPEAASISVVRTGLSAVLVLVYAPRSRRTAWLVVGVTLVTAATVAAVVVRTLLLT